MDDIEYEIMNYPEDELFKILRKKFNREKDIFKSGYYCENKKEDFIGCMIYRIIGDDYD